MRIFNTLTRKKEIFRPLKKGRVGLYTCGPTVYNYAHIGNLRTYIFEDVLERALEHEGYAVRRVMNVTDVGHLTSDADAGEDKLEKGAKREKKSPWDIAKFYTKAFIADLGHLNIKKPDVLAPATKFIPEQIKLIEQLFSRGYAYETPRAIYFDVSKFKGYMRLSRQKLAEKSVRARTEVVEDPQKRNPHDFALWFKRVGRFKNHIMHWASPWGVGFPGWHVECSAISSALLGQPFDIHTGGIDHIAVHHTNEMAQSEGAYGRPLAKYWMHGEFLLMGKGKMAKSGSSFITLADIVKKGFDPLAYRLFVLGAHYRTPLTFSYEALHAAENALAKMRRTVSMLKSEKINKTRTPNSSSKIYMRKFSEALADDLNTPKALAVLWNVLDDMALSPHDKLSLVLSFDKVVALGLKDIKKLPPAPLTVQKLAAERELYRRHKQFAQADALRVKIGALGYSVEDTPEGPVVHPL